MVPKSFIDRLCSRVGVDLLFHFISKLGVALFSSRKSYAGKIGGQESVFAQIVNGRGKFSPGEIAGRSENDKNARVDIAGRSARLFENVSSRIIRHNETSFRDKCWLFLKWSSRFR